MKKLPVYTTKRLLPLIYIVMFIPVQVDATIVGNDDFKKIAYDFVACPSIAGCINTGKPGPNYEEIIVTGGPTFSGTPYWVLWDAPNADPSISWVSAADLMIGSAASIRARVRDADGNLKQVLIDVSGPGYYKRYAFNIGGSDRTRTATFTPTALGTYTASVYVKDQENANAGWQSTTFEVKNSAPININWGAQRGQ